MKRKAPIEMVSYLNKAIGYHEAVRDAYNIAIDIAEKALKTKNSDKRVPDEFFTALEEIMNSRYPTDQIGEFDE